MKNPKKEFQYTDYLQLDRILLAQNLLSAESGDGAHEEMLFIIMHQVYELWFKQILHELDSILEIFKNPKKSSMESMIIRFHRIRKILELLMKQFEVIETMTPLQFLNFRGNLGVMSGFQSFQFRLIETKLGLKREERLLYNQCPFDGVLRKEHQELIKKAEHSPNLFNMVENWLEQIPYIKSKNYSFPKSYHEAFDKMMEHEKDHLFKHPYLLSENQKHVLEHSLDDLSHHFEAIFDESKYDKLLDENKRRFSYKAFLGALFLRLYSQHSVLNVPDKLLSEIYELNSLFLMWRFRHSVMVQKMIGWKSGTGGSSGVDYLRSTVEKHNIFSDLYVIPMVLLPEKYVPALPKDLLPTVDYFFGM